MATSKATATIVGAIVFATLIWAGLSYRSLHQSEESQPQAEVAGTVDEHPLTIGVIAPLTGEYSQLGQAMREGIELAQMQTTHPADISFQDSQCSPQTAVDLANQLISQNQVNAIIGDGCLEATLAVVPLTDQHQVVLINPVVTDARLTGAGSYLYRTIPHDQTAGQFTAEQLYRDGRRRLALISDNHPSSLTYRQTLINAWESLGAIIVTDQVIPDDPATSSNINLSKIAPSADAILLLAASPESAALLIEQTHLDNSDLPSYGNTSFTTIELPDMTVIRPQPGTSDFQDQYSQTFGHSPLPYAAQAYDAYLAIVSAYQSDSDTFINNLNNLDITGVTGQIAFNNLGDINPNFDVYTFPSVSPEPSPAR